MSIEQNIAEREELAEFGWLKLNYDQLIMIREAIEGPLSDTSDFSLQEANCYIQFIMLLHSFYDIETYGGIAKFTSNLRITPTELAVCIGLARIGDRKRLCKLLNISNKTFKNHLASIVRKIWLAGFGSINSLGIVRLMVDFKAFSTNGVESLPDAGQFTEILRCLSNREIEVVNLVKAGTGLKFVARILGIKTTTVKNHLSAARRKIRVVCGRDLIMVERAFLFNQR